MKITAPARSDQINADDFIGGPAIFTIAGVIEGKAEQRYDIQLEESPGKAWRPPLTVLRVLIAAWGDEAADWVGRSVKLYRDTSVSFGKDAVGGIRIEAMSHLPNNEPLETKVQVSRAKRVTVRVEPLLNAPKPANDLPGRITKALGWFAAKGVQQSNLEAHLGRPVDEWTASDLDGLTQQRDAIVAELTAEEQA